MKSPALRGAFFVDARAARTLEFFVKLPERAELYGEMQKMRDDIQ